jgi:hypothetical protein
MSWAILTCLQDSKELEQYDHLIKRVPFSYLQEIQMQTPTLHIFDLHGDQNRFYLHGDNNRLYIHEVLRRKNILPQTIKYLRGQ